MMSFMQKLARFGVAVSVTVALAACGGNNSAGTTSSPAVTVDEAKEAFIFALMTVLNVTFWGMWGEIEGVTLDSDAAVTRINGLDFTWLADEIEVPYTAVSGTLREVGYRLIADLQLVGGPVATIAFSLGAPSSTLPKASRRP